MRCQSLSSLVRVLPLVALALVFCAPGAHTQPSENESNTGSRIGQPGRPTLRGKATPAGTTPVTPAQPVDAVASDPCNGSYPLPFATHWTPHRKERSGSTQPPWQIEQLQNGRHWMPAFWMGNFRQGWDKWAQTYYPALLAEARRRQLPIAFVSTQWDRVIYEESPWKDAAPENSALFRNLEGHVEAKLDPFGAKAPWSEAGHAWSSAEVMTKLQELYPDPPYVVFVSNNEAARLEQREVELSAAYQARYGAGHDEDFRRRKLGDHYIDRYKAHVEGFRSGLGVWKDRSIIIGWGGSTIGLGRGDWWPNGNLPNNGMSVPGRLSVFPFAWDGSAVRYYVKSQSTHDFSDHTFRSPQAEIMNLPLQIEFACQQNPKYYWELTTFWDPVVRERMAKEGQPVTTERYAGLVKYGMWVARPHAVRKFTRGYMKLSEFGGDLGTVMDAVDDVHNDPVLASFWKQSDLVWNPDRQHPYRSSIPPEYANRRRWLQLSTSVDAADSRSLTTEVPMWSFARVQGDPGSRRWLIFVQSPKQVRPDVRVDLPDQPGSIRVSATPAGCFYLVEEGSSTATSLPVNATSCRVVSSG